MDTLYLNNDGSRWIFRNPEMMYVYVRDKAGNYNKRKVKYWFSFGNFAGCAVKFKGKVIQKLPKDCERHEHLPIIEE